MVERTLLKPVELPDRVTVVEQVYHQTSNGNPFHYSSGYVRHLKTREQPYLRTAKVGEDFEPISLGWLDGSSLLKIKNDEGKFYQRIPTEEELQEVAGKVLEIAFWQKGACLLIPPGEDCRFTPVPGVEIAIRCQRGTARYTITAIPL